MSVSSAHRRGARDRLGRAEPAALEAARVTERGAAEGVVARVDLSSSDGRAIGGATLANERSRERVADENDSPGR